MGVSDDRLNNSGQNTQYEKVGPPAIRHGIGKKGMITYITHRHDECSITSQRVHLGACAMQFVVRGDGGATIG